MPLPIIFNTLLDSPLEVKCNVLKGRMIECYLIFEAFDISNHFGHVGIKYMTCGS